MRFLMQLSRPINDFCVGKDGIVWNSSFTIGSFDSSFSSTPFGGLCVSLCSCPGRSMIFAKVKMALFGALHSRLEFLTVRSVQIHLEACGLCLCASLCSCPGRSMFFSSALGFPSIDYPSVIYILSIDHALHRLSMDYPWIIHRLSIDYDYA